MAVVAFELQHRAQAILLEPFCYPQQYASNKPLFPHSSVDMLNIAENLASSRRFHLATSTASPQPRPQTLQSPKPKHHKSRNSPKKPLNPKPQTTQPAPRWSLHHTKDPLLWAVWKVKGRGVSSIHREGIQQELSMKGFGV